MAVLQSMFALEIIDEKGYLNGRLVDGQYFFSRRINSICGKKLNPESTIGLCFTGLVKVREYVHGYEWARFQYDPRKKGAVDIPVTHMLRSLLNRRYIRYSQHYKDAHERNLMFEIRDKKEKGIPFITKDFHGNRIICRIGLRAIDLRS